MADYDLDPQFEQHLERVLRGFADEGVGRYDAAETTHTAVHRPPRSRQRWQRTWLRPMLMAAVLAGTLLAVGVVGGLVKLPITELDPNPSFQPFSPAPPLTFEPTVVPGSPSATQGPPGSALPTSAPGTFDASAPPATLPSTGTPAPSPSAVPPTDLPTSPPASPTTVPTEEPTLEPTLEPTPDPTAEPTPPALVVVAAEQGDLHSCALAEDGRIFCWGTNDSGELGDGTQTSRFTADVPVAGIDDATSIAAGIRFSCATRAGGSAWCWGEDPGSNGTDTVPRRVNGVDNAVSVVAGGAHACALERGGTVLCWGVGSLGQLGNGEFDHSSGVATAQAVDGIANAVQIAAGWNHTCARLADGTIRCWGGNGDGATGYGQLGDGTFENRASPVEVLGVSDAVDVAAGGWTTCAVLRGGSATCWGYGERGGLGNGERDNSPTPVQVNALGDARSVVVGRFHACAQRGGGTVACWGAVGWGGGNDTSVPVNGGSEASSAQLSTDRSLLLVTRRGELLEWTLGNDDGPQPIAVGP